MTGVLGHFVDWGAGDGFADFANLIGSISPCCRIQHPPAGTLLEKDPKLVVAAVPAPVVPESGRLNTPEKDLDWSERHPDLGLAWCDGIDKAVYGNGLVGSATVVDCDGAFPDNRGYRGVRYLAGGSRWKSRFEFLESLGDHCQLFFDGGEPGIRALSPLGVRKDAHFRVALGVLSEDLAGTPQQG